MEMESGTLVISIISALIIAFMFWIINKINEI